MFTKSRPTGAAQAGRLSVRLSSSAGCRKHVRRARCVCCECLFLCVIVPQSASHSRGFVRSPRMAVAPRKCSCAVVQFGRLAAAATGRPCNDAGAACSHRPHPMAVEMRAVVLLRVPMKSACATSKRNRHRHRATAGGRDVVYVGCLCVLVCVL